jgi:hypothetical protein
MEEVRFPKSRFRQSFFPATLCGVLPKTDKAYVFLYSFERNKQSVAYLCPQLYCLANLCDMSTGLTVCVIQISVTRKHTWAIT